MNIQDALSSHVEKRAQTFGIRPGMTIVDYGCGPGRYSMVFARLAGETGRICAVDVHPLAIEYVKERSAKAHLQNIEALLAVGYRSPLPDHIANVVCALDMFFAVHDPSALLAELKRVAKPDGVLIIDDGHQPRAITKKKMADAGLWTIVEETADHLMCRPAAG